MNDENNKLLLSLHTGKTIFLIFIRSFSFNIHIHWPCDIVVNMQIYLYPCAYLYYSICIPLFVLLCLDDRVADVVVEVSPYMCTTICFSFLLPVCLCVRATRTYEIDWPVSVCNLRDVYRCTVNGGMCALFLVAIFHRHCFLVFMAYLLRLARTLSCCFFCLCERFVWL